MDINLKNYWRINKAKKHNHIFKISVLSAENRFPTVSRVNPDPMESIPQVDLLNFNQKTCPSGCPQGYFIFHCLVQSRNSCSTDFLKNTELA